MERTVFITKIAFPSLREQKDNVVLAGGTIRPLGNLWEAGSCWRKVSCYHGNVKDFEYLRPTLACQSLHSFDFVFRVGDVIAQFSTCLLLLCLAHTPGTTSLSNSFICCFGLCCAVWNKKVTNMACFWRERLCHWWSVSLSLDLLEKEEHGCPFNITS